MTEPKVMIGVPMTKDFKIDLRTSYWCNREKDFGVGWTFRADAGGSVSRNKNAMIKLLLEKDFTHFFCMNNDTWTSHNAVNKLLAHDVDIVSGVAPGFSGEFFWMGQLERNVVLKIHKLPDKLTKAARGGGPGMLVKRKVFEKMEFPWFDFIQGNDGQEMSEDYYFSDKAVDMGFEVWIDPNIVLHHCHNGMDLLPLAEAVGRAKRKD